MEVNMPYIRKGKTVYKKVDGLKKKGTSKTTGQAKAHLRVLQGIEHGWKPTGKKRRK